MTFIDRSVGRTVMTVDELIAWAHEWDQYDASIDGPHTMPFWYRSERYENWWGAGATLDQCLGPAVRHGVPAEVGAVAGLTQVLEHGLLDGVGLDAGGEVPVPGEYPARSAVVVDLLVAACGAADSDLDHVVLVVLHDVDAGGGGEVEAVAGTEPAAPAGTNLQHRGAAARVTDDRRQVVDLVGDQVVVAPVVARSSGRAGHRSPR
ncbi:hypothetical protein P3T35_007871 [Kitasatospora sp. GP30]|uniref:hypothetical protein n=1 Tax=Kitasatospora sp. GP30 TaxID=3035084 RepID=UPI00117D3F02|nr:hypothetical protein [Kitasatospora sp. GP30]MDH6145810.1 hypothetical protein [Kitasatospora sp. GP30]